MAKQKKDAKGEAATKKAASKKSAPKNTGPKKSAAEKSAPKKSASKKSDQKKSASKKSDQKKSAATKSDQQSTSKKSAPKNSEQKKADGKKSGPKKSAPKSAPSRTASPDLPGTLERSPAKVQRTYEKTLESAEAGYGDEERAHRTAWGAVKNVAEKRGDHWELKDSTGPSDPRSQMPADKKRAGEGETFGGVDVVGNSRQELMERAKKAGIRGYSRMTKAELGRQLSRHE